MGRLKERVMSLVIDAGVFLGEILDRRNEKVLSEYDGEAARRIIRKSALKFSNNGLIVEEYEFREPRRIYKIKAEEGEKLPKLLLDENGAATGINFQYIENRGNLIEIDGIEERRRYFFAPDKESLGEKGAYINMTEEEAVELVNWIGRRAGVIK